MSNSYDRSNTSTTSTTILVNLAKTSSDSFMTESSSFSWISNGANTASFNNSSLLRTNSAFPSSSKYAANFTYFVISFFITRDTYLLKIPKIHFVEL